MPQLAFQFDTLKAEVEAIGGIVPRDYQSEAIKRTFELWDAGTVGVLVRQPTGTGKTIGGSLISRKWLELGADRRVLVLAHERQLVHQFAEEIQDILRIQPGIEMANEAVKANRIPKITVASRATLIERKKKNENGEEETVSRLLKFDPLRYKWLIILDEAHRWLWSLKSCRPILEHFAANPDSRRLGLTATPQRGDKKTLGKIFQAAACDYRFHDLFGGASAVTDGWAVPYDLRFITVEGVDFKQLSVVAQDFDEHDLEAKLGERKTLLSFVKPTIDLVGERRCLCFSPTVKMAQWVAHTLNEFKDGSAVSIDGTTPEFKRKQVYRAHQTGEFQFLSVCGLCVAKGTSVLTDRGDIPIERVTTGMKLWDGVEFVSHDGVIAKGTKPVIRYAGLTATGDHNVWTDHGWERLAACKQRGIAIRVSAVGGKAVRESDGHYRDDHSGWKEPTGQSDGAGVQQEATAQGLPQEIAEVFDILNAGPRHRFTANGLIVSNCREGYNDPGIGAIAIYRPTKSKALKEQMLGRGCRPLRGIVNSEMTKEQRLETIANSAKPNCLVIDLVGITGMGESVSAAHVLAGGLPDEVIERANKNALEKTGSVDMAEELRNAKRQIDDEKESLRKKQARLETEARERRERMKMARLQAEVRYTAHQVDHAHGARVTNPNGREVRMLFGKHKGKPISQVPFGYLRWLSELKLKPWYRQAILNEMERRKPKRPVLQTASYELPF